MKNGDFPAHPTEYRSQDGTPDMIPGLTKREYFAAMAMQGLLGNNIVKDLDLAKEMIAADALVYADELLKQLESN